MPASIVQPANPVGGASIINTELVDGVGGVNKANVDADGKLLVHDTASINVNNGQQASTGAAATLLIARATRKKATIRNQDGANSVWLGIATVTSANGILLKAGESRDYFGKPLLQIIDNNVGHAIVDFIDYFD